MLTMGVAAFTLLLCSDSIQKYTSKQIKLVEFNLKERWYHQKDNTNFWDNIQSSYQCCGLQSGSDYLANFLPSTCCPNAGVCNVHVAYQGGCLGVITKYIVHVGNTMSIVAYVTSWLGVCGSIIAFMTAFNQTFRYKKMDNEQTDV